MKASCGHVLCFIPNQTVEIFQYFCQFIEASSSSPAHYCSPVTVACALRHEVRGVTCVLEGD
jgi:hypothetical protein